MSKKFKVTTVAILAAVTFATTAFAGIFDVVGAVVGGSNYYAQKAKQSGNSYLEKLAVKIRETGDPDAVFDSVVKEYKDGKYDVNVSETDGGNVKTMTATRSDMLVRAIWILDKNTQTITTKHENAANGTPVGEPMTKKYDLPDGVQSPQVANTAAVQHNTDTTGMVPVDNVQTSNNLSGTYIGSSTLNKLAAENVKVGFVGLETNMDGNYPVNYKLVLENGLTGCQEFDRSKLKGDTQLAHWAFCIARTGNTKLSAYAKQRIEGIAHKTSDPFATSQLVSIFDKLVSFYKSMKPLDLCSYARNDYVVYMSGKENFTGEDADRVFNSRIFEIATKPMQFFGNASVTGALLYSTDSQGFYFGNNTVKLSGFNIQEYTGCNYFVPVPSDKVSAVYKKIIPLLKQNNDNVVKLAKLAAGTRLKVTKIRVFVGFSSVNEIPFGEAVVFSNCIIKVQTMDGYVVKPRKPVGLNREYDFSNGKWTTLLEIKYANPLRRTKNN